MASPMSRLLTGRRLFCSKTKYPRCARANGCPCADFSCGLLTLPLRAANPWAFCLGVPCSPTVRTAGRKLPFRTGGRCVSRRYAANHSPVIRVKVLGGVMRSPKVLHVSTFRARPDLAVSALPTLALLALLALMLLAWPLTANAQAHSGRGRSGKAKRRGAAEEFAVQRQFPQHATLPAGGQGPVEGNSELD